MIEAFRTVLILGSTSDIGRAIAVRYAMQGWALQLAGRNVNQLYLDSQDLRIRFEIPVSVHEFDAQRRETHKEFVSGLSPLPDTAICVVGLLGDQAGSEINLDEAERVMATNYLGPARIFGELANRFQARGSGTLIGVSSVAGDRGRATNYVYGSAKAGFTVFLSGLRNRLAKKRVHVITVKPGFVRTRMTEGIYLPAILTAETDEVADAVFRADQHQTNIVYVRPIWRWIMAAVRIIPEAIFKNLRI